MEQDKVVQLTCERNGKFWAFQTAKIRVRKGIAGLFSLTIHGVCSRERETGQGSDD